MTHRRILISIETKLDFLVQHRKTPKIPLHDQLKMFVNQCASVVNGTQTRQAFLLKKTLMSIPPTTIVKDASKYLREKILGLVNMQVHGRVEPWKKESIAVSDEAKDIELENP